jgi:cation:H+ antiporter
VIDFHQLPLGLSLGLFAVAAAVVWWAGTRIAHAANDLSDHLGIGKAFAGALLLGGITSLPEVAVTLTASISGQPKLAVNNLLGGVAFQVVLLAVADAVYGRRALSGVVAQPVVQLQGVVGVVLLAIVAMTVTAGEVDLGGFGAGALAATVASVAALWLVRKAQDRPAWKPTRPVEKEGADGRPAEEPVSSLRRSATTLAVGGAAILAAGYVLSQTADVIAEATGLGQSYVGAVLLAASTSLPEISTIVAAVRLRQFAMAYSDIFGTNLFDLTLLLLVDVAYTGGPVLGAAGPFAAAAALLGIVVTGLAVAGLIERRDRAFLRMGVDSLLIIVSYLAGLALLYQLR